MESYRAAIPESYLWYVMDVVRGVGNARGDRMSGERWSMTKSGNRFHIISNPGIANIDGIALCNSSYVLWGTTGTTSTNMPAKMMCKQCLKLAGYHDHE
jgi:hypothetical protein